MKKILILTVCILFIIGCTDKKKEEEKAIEQSLQKIDAIEESVKEGIQNLENAIEDVEEAVEELDNI